jgi:hypothetical protein
MHAVVSLKYQVKEKNYQKGPRKREVRERTKRVAGRRSDIHAPNEE